MNKKIKSFLCAALLLFSITDAQANSLSALSFTLSSVAQSSVFEQLPKLIYEYPLFSTMIAVIISIAGYKKIFYFRNLATPDPTRPQSHYPNITPSYHKESDDWTITLINNDNKKYEHPNIHSFQVSPQNKYLLLCQREDIPATESLGQAYASKKWFTTLVKNAIRTIPVTRLIDIQTGKEILSIKNAHCVFNKEEDILLIRELTEVSRLKRFMHRLLGCINIYKEKQSPTDQREFVDTLQYRLFHIPSKKDIRVFNSVRSASFDANDNVIIVDENSTIKKYKKGYFSSVFTKLNLFSAPIYYYTKNKPIQADSLPCRTEFFNRIDKSHTLRLINQNNEIVKNTDFDQVINYVRRGKYLLINQKNTKNDTLGGKTLQNIVGTRVQKTINAALEVLQSSEYTTLLIDAETGEPLPRFTYETPLFCSFVPNKEEIIIIDRDTLNYIQFDLTTQTAHTLRDANAICFDKNASFFILDSQQTPCSKSPSFMDQIEQTAEEVGAELLTQGREFVAQIQQTVMPIISSQSPVKLPTKRYSIKLIIDLPYDKYLYVGEKDHDAIDPSIHKLIKKGIYGFEWNIHPFVQAYNNYLIRENTTEPSICISNKYPITEKVNSLQSALYSLLTFIKKSGNHPAILTIFLKNNTCDTKTIDMEIKKVLTKHDYTDKTPLLRAQKLQNWPTLGEMMQDKKYLVIFNSTDQDSRYTLSHTRANPDIAQYFAKNAALCPDLFTQANQANENYMKTIQFS